MIPDKSQFDARFEAEFYNASLEVVRLEQLLKDAYWYNFEVACRTWKSPWRQTDQHSSICLFGQRYEHYEDERELFTCPIYFSGEIRNAPPLPPEILLNELDEARAYKEACREQCMAPYDWAPGGYKYNMLRRTTIWNDV